EQDIEPEARFRRPAPRARAAHEEAWIYGGGRHGDGLEAISFVSRAVALLGRSASSGRSTRTWRPVAATKVPARSRGMKTSMGGAPVRATHGVSERST